MGREAEGQPGQEEALAKHTGTPRWVRLQLEACTRALVTAQEMCC